MTKVTYIHGVPDASRIPANEMADRGKLVTNKPYIDWSGMTSGELKLALLYEQLDIFAQYYPENPVYSANADRIIDVLAGGLQKTTVQPAGNDDLSRMVTATIKKAQRKTRAAGFLLPKARKPGLTDAALAGIRGIGNPIIPPIDCSQYTTTVLIPQGTIDIESTVITDQAAYAACMHQAELVSLLNNHLAKAGHHLLYAYVNNPNAQPPVVVAKYVDHVKAIGAFAGITRLDIENMKMWVRNGIIRGNATGGATPLQPTATYDIIKAHWTSENQAGIGDFGATAAIIIAIIGIISAAATAAANIINAARAADRQRLQNEAHNMGGPGFGPQREDFPSNYTDPNNFSNAEELLPGIDNNILLVGALAAGGLLITQMD